MVYMIVYASCTHVETPLARPYRVSGVDALSQTSIRLPEYTEPVLQTGLVFTSLIDFHALAGEVARFGG